eukprot:7348283-Alexandrium_andersonii.AAC.1
MAAGPCGCPIATHLDWLTCSSTVRLALPRCVEDRQRADTVIALHSDAAASAEDRVQAIKKALEGIV